MGIRVHPLSSFEIPLCPEATRRRAPFFREAAALLGVHTTQTKELFILDPYPVSTRSRRVR